jgi:hypothetical protein
MTLSPDGPVSLPVPNPQQQKEETSRAQKFLDSMSRRSTEVPTDFLNTIKEEERTKSPELNGSGGENGNASIGKILAKKYPFNRCALP